jgi:outer membrane lipoprotein-sorting protein
MALMNFYRSNKLIQFGLLLFGFFAFTPHLFADQLNPPNPDDLIRAAMNHWRGVTSYSDMSMTVHRADWQRSFSMLAWTKGEKTSLVRVTEPKRDAGNGTLILDKNMWSYTPKVNRIIKIPSSMMGQSWMGSDFSNKDISKSTDIIDDYDHSLIGSEEKDGHFYYTIESVPHEEAAVVWGKEVVTIRDDYVMMRQEFWDQDGVLVKEMNALEVMLMDGREIATRMRMNKIETPDEWTDMLVNSIDFDVDLADSLFTLSNLRNPRQ